jgi:hypothetical protein
MPVSIPLDFYWWVRSHFPVFPPHLRAKKIKTSRQNAGEGRRGAAFFGPSSVATAPQLSVIFSGALVQKPLSYFMPMQILDLIAAVQVAQSVGIFSLFIRVPLIMGRYADNG